MTIQAEHQIRKHWATAQEAVGSAHEVLGEIERLWAAAQAAADSEKFAEWLTRHAEHLADAAIEACVNAGHLDGEHLVEVTATA